MNSLDNIAPLSSLNSRQTDNVSIMPEPERYQIISEIITTVSNTPEIMRRTAGTSRLSELAIQRLVRKDSGNTDLWISNVTELSNFLKSKAFPGEVNDSLYRESFRQLQYENNRTLSRGIASGRVQQGESSAVVAQQHGIPFYGRAKGGLQMIAVNGPAGKRVRSGESCEVVAREHGMYFYDNAMHTLQMIAVNGPAGKRVRSGESCAVVAREHGIYVNGEAMYELQMIAVNGPAGKRVQDGESFAVVAREHGILSGGKAMGKLMKIAIM